MQAASLHARLTRAIAMGDIEATERYSDDVSDDTINFTRDLLLMKK